MTTDPRPSTASPTGLDDAFALRRRPPAEKLIDIGFRQLTLALAAVVAIVLVGIFLVVFMALRPQPR